MIPTRLPAQARSSNRAPQGHPGAARVGGDAKEVHDASFDLDDEQHVVAAEEGGVDGEEVGGDDTFGLGTEELVPARSGAARCWRKPMTSQDVGDAALRDCDAEFLQFPDDAEVAPARVLSGQTDDQFDLLLR